MSNKAASSRFHRSDPNQRIEAGGFQRINNKIAPGVSLMEPKDAKRRTDSEQDYMRISGGTFRPQQNDSTQRMSTDEYAKLLGIRQY